MVSRHCGADSPAPSFEKVVLLLLAMLGVVACGTVEEDTERETASGDVAHTDAAVPFDGGCLSTDCAFEDSASSDTDAERVDVETEGEPYDENCHTDCQAEQICEDGIVWGSGHSPAPCWVVPRFEGQGPCTTTRWACASGTCGPSGVVCEENEMWVWSGGFESGTTEWGRLEDRNIYDRESGSLRFSVDADGTFIAPFMLLLTNCESMLESVPSADLRAWDCNAQLERGDEPPRTVRALLRTTDSFTDEGFALGSVTWWEDGQLVRLDWQTHTPLFLPGRCRFAWREGVTEPVPPWPAEPTEGSGEGSGTPIEGSGTPIEGSGEPTPD